MTHRVGAKGQVVIPKGMRDSIGLRPGDRVEFELDSGTVRVRPPAATGTHKGMLSQHPLTRQLEADRRNEPR